MTFKEMWEEFQYYMLDPFRRRKDEWSEADNPFSEYNGDGSETAFLPHVLGIAGGLAFGRLINCGAAGYIISIVICIFLFGFVKSNGIDGLPAAQSARMNLMATIVILLLFVLPIALAFLLPKI